MATRILRAVIFLTVLAFIVLGVIYIRGLQDRVQNGTAPSLTGTAEPEAALNDLSEDAQYTNYTPEKLNNQYERHILFFYASWCPECRSFERSLVSNDIPDGIQILKLDYDRETELKQKYGVTLQTTFVEVDEKGKQIAKWTGYGRDKTVTAVLNGLKGN